MDRFSEDRLAHKAIDINRAECMKKGEPHLLLHREQLYGAVGRPLTTFGGTYLYRSLTLRASVLVGGLIKDHPFAQANKRTAWLMGVYFIQGYGWDVEDISDIEAEKQVLAIAECASAGAQQQEEEIFASWLANHLVRLPPRI